MNITRINWKDKEHWVFYSLLLVFVYFFSYWIYHLLAFPLSWHADFVNEASYLQLSFEQKSLLPIDYRQPHELLITRLWPVYWIVYAITHNFILSYQIMNIAGQLLMLAALVCLMKQLKLRRTAIMLTLCLFWSLNAQKLVLFMIPAYQAITACALLSLAYLIKIDRHWETEKRFFKKSLWPYYMILITLSSYFGFATIRLISTFYIPWFAVTAIIVFRKYIRKKTIEKRALYSLGLSALLTAVAMASYAICMNTCQAYFTPLSMTITDVSKWLTWDQLSTQLQSLLSALNLSGGGASFQGMFLFGLSVLFVLFQLFALYFTLRYGETRHLKMVAAFLCITTIILFSLQLIGEINGFAPRYYFITTIFSLLVCGIFVSDQSYQMNFRMIPSMLLIIFLVVYKIVNPILYDDISQNEEKDFIAISDYMEDSDYQKVMASYWYSSPIKGYSNGTIENQHFPSVETFEPFSWLIDARKFSDQQSGEPTVLLLTDDEEAYLLKDRAGAQLLAQYGEKVHEIGGFNLYEFLENPLILYEEIDRTFSAELPQDEQTQKTIFLDSTGFQIVGAVFEDDQHTILSSGENAGFVLYGPYQKTIEGTYDFILHYEIVSQEDQQTHGYFDVAIDAIQAASVDLEMDDTSVSLQNIRFDSDDHVFETRVFIPEGTIIRILSIEYIRKE